MDISGDEMVATWRLYAHLVCEVPLLVIYILAIIACMGNDSSGKKVVCGALPDVYKSSPVEFSMQPSIYAPIHSFISRK